MFDSGEDLPCDEKLSESQLQDNCQSQADNIKVRLKIKISDSFARTILPKDYIKDLTLTAKKADGREETLVDSVTNIKLENLTQTEMSSSVIELLCGVYTFTMSGKAGKVTFIDTFSKEIKNDSDTSLTFNLKPVDSDGNEITKGTLDLSLSFNFEGKSEAVFTVLKINKLGAADVLISEAGKIDCDNGIITNGKITFKKDMIETDAFDEGTYDITIDFYGDSEYTVLLNKWEAYARIVPGYVSKGIFTGYSLNDVYSIKIFNEKTGQNISADSPVSIIPLYFSRKSEDILLPVYECEDWIFAGWYTSSDFAADSKIEKIKHGTAGDIELYERWLRSLVFVSAEGSSTNDGFSEESALPSVSDALKKIKMVTSLTEEAYDYTIKVCGSLKENAVIGSDITSDVAKSITLIGKTGSSTDNLDGDKKGSVLSIKTRVPVTVKNMKITGGSSSNGGGGIYAEGCTLVLTGDTEVISCSASGSSQGGGIAIISTDDYAASLTISENASIKSCSNTGSSAWGGGIYANGKKLKRTKITLSDNACITGCSSSEGGGIGLVDYNDLLIEDSVEISGNTASKTGGGLRIWNSSATMAGGIIKKNSAAKGGGGVSVNRKGTFVIKESAYIPYGTDKKNDVQLIEGDTEKTPADWVATFITLGGALTPPSEATNAAGKTTVAVINCEKWKRGFTVVKADETNITDLSSYENFFAFAEEPWEAAISSDNKSLTLDNSIYVAGSVTHPVCKVAGNDSNRGTKSAPLATIKKACEKMNNSGVDYVILVDGAVTGAQEIPSSLTKSANAKSLLIQGADSTAKLDGEKTENTTVLKIDSDVPVTILNLTITGGNNAQGDGGGIYISNSSANLVLGNGSNSKLVTVTENKANKGGGIYNSGKLTIKKGVVISSNTALVKSGTAEGGGIFSSKEVVMEGGEVTLNTSGSDLSGNGGGISFTGIFTMTGGSISDNTAYSNGGGIFAKTSSETISISGGALTKNTASCDGGGISSAGSVTISGGSFTGNKAKNNGGAVYCQSDVIVYGTAVFGGSAADANSTEEKCGGAIYAPEVYLGYSEADTSKKSEWSGKISGNTAADYGGGISIPNSGHVYMASGSIESNTSKTQGGGVYLAGYAEMFMTGGTIKNNTAAYGGAVNANGKLHVGGDAYIPYGGKIAKNDVRIDPVSSEPVIIESALKKHSASSPLVITLSESKYAAGEQVLTGTDALISDNYTKFDTSSELYGINSEGKLAVLTHTSPSLDDLTSFLSTLSSKKMVEITITTDISGTTSNKNQPLLTIPAGKNIKLTGSKTIQFTSNGGGDDYTFIKVSAGAKLTIDSGITLKGADYGNGHVYAICAEANSEVVMESGAKITGFKGNSSGTVLIKSGATFTMNGGSITNNKARYGSAVYLYSGSTFNFYGGSISGNSDVNGKAIDGSGNLNWKKSAATMSPESIGSNITKKQI